MALHLVYKQKGKTPLQALECFREQEQLAKDVSLTYAGRLDPAAEGVLLILSEKDVYRKEEFLSLPKTYEFEVLFGVTTDTLDVLGIPKIHAVPNDFVSSKVFDLLTNFVGTFEWEYPAYSSKTVNGKPLFEYAREDASVEIPKRMMTIEKLDVLGMKVVNLEDIESGILETIESVDGDFRQRGIVEAWRKMFTLYGNKHFSVVRFKADVRSGTYIRVLAEKMAGSLQLPGMALSIKRTKIGTMSVS